MANGGKREFALLLQGGGIAVKLGQSLNKRRAAVPPHFTNGRLGELGLVKKARGRTNARCKQPQFKDNAHATYQTNHRIPGRNLNLM
jgi:hypothetical protein